MKKLLFALLLFACTVPLASADEFKTPSPEELALKDNPKHPGDHAMILEWNRVEDDTEGYEDNYYRVKIFTDQGKKYADIEIPFFKDDGPVTSIKARTIHADGTIVPFNGKVYEKTIVKGKGLKYVAKTFTLPDVQPGSIIEYRYRRHWEPHNLYDRKWTLQTDLYVKKAHFQISPHQRSEYGTMWQAFRLPAGKDFKKVNNNVVQLDLEDIPAFVEERFAPPEKELMMRFDFFYRELDDNAKTAGEFWQHIAEKSYKDSENFIGRRKGIAAATAALVSPNDPAETKLKKIYEKVQSLRNVSFERRKTEQEQQREKSKDNKNVEDVLNRGYGDREDMIHLFVAMVRAAGMEAYVARVSERDETFFNINTVNARQLDGHLAYVKADGKVYWLDPSTPFCAFGQLPWRKTATAALLLDTKGKANFVTTPGIQSNQAITRRVANLSFADGLFKGEVSVNYTGQEALYRRISAKLEDEQSVRQDLEEDLKEDLPGGSTIKLKKVEGLDGKGDEIIAVFDVEVPNPPSSAGSRYLMSTSIFSRGQSPFRHEKREHPVYFRFPFQVIETVKLALPPEFKVEAVPDRHHVENDIGYFDAVWRGENHTITMTRGFAVPGLLYPLEMYPAIRDFYSKVASGDEENVVLRANQSASN